MAMRERPILMSAPMVRAILEGRKTQTRRVVKDQGLPCVTDAQWADRIRRCCRCPYGQPGDRLWVRETLKASHLGLTYAADDASAQGACADILNERYARTPPFELEPRCIPAIHMPRWASRILLEVTDVRVQRLQAISAGDAVAEGIDLDFHDSWHPSNQVGAYRRLWESINGPGSWDANPWVWAITFRRLEADHA